VRSETVEGKERERKQGKEVMGEMHGKFRKNVSRRTKAQCRNDAGRERVSGKGNSKRGN